MELQEYKNIYDNEKNHFFYVSTNSLVISLIKQYKQSLKFSLRSNYKKSNDLKILDAGCGTGLLGKMMQKIGDVSAIDFSSEAVKFAKKRGLNVKRASIERLPFRDKSFDTVVSIDVLTHKSINNDLTPLKEFYRVLKPDGLLILRVSANSWLKLNHDKHVHMDHRYDYGELQRKLLNVDFLIEKLSFINFSLFPLQVLRLCLEKIIPPRETSSVIGKTNPYLNQLLTKILLFEGALFTKINYPFGIGLMAVCRKRKS